MYTEAYGAARAEESLLTARLLRPLLNDVAPDAVAVDISKSGTKVVWTSANPKYDFSSVNYLPSIFEYQLGEPQPRSLLRSQLVAVDRLQVGVDKVEYPDGQLAIFKYNPHSSGHHMWHEIQVLAQVGGHPHILPLDALVLEEVTGQGVVGFTSRFVPGGTLEDRRQFKLKWLHELMGVIDHVNFQHGISHQDIANRNVLIDPDTDSALLFDFGHSQPVGRVVTLASRNDAKGLLVLVYHLVTRDPRYDVYYLHDVDETELEDRVRWKKHADVELDCDLDVLFSELMAWVRKRRNGPQPTAAVPSNPVIIPTCPKGPKDVAGDDAINLAGTLAWVRTLHGRPNLCWRRPKRKDIDKSRRLLATGRYADEEPIAPQCVAADLTLGFPQPPKQSLEPSTKSQPLVNGYDKQSKRTIEQACGGDNNNGTVSGKPAKRRVKR
ncbi:hypothetical protein B0T25DRAFT_457472 [Lasiosphaeria hispida]|uniref:non-specific serine/threonine protein kinase n=1 Tax=Lasiosphaeria hispida TaxID=260671 RepID=A0AAJ0MC74_9PEZI|nr:hypothetical protein B0T25DRAFT_457472 [Lasiosphaeria hispida]